MTSSDPAAWLAEVTDGERMREVLAQHLVAPDAPPVAVVGCQVEFARRGSRRLVQYRVTLRDPVGGEIRNRPGAVIENPGDMLRGAERA